MKRTAARRFQPHTLLRIAAISILAACFTPAQVALSQTDPELNELRDEIKKLVERQHVFEKELQELKARVRPRAAAVEAVERVLDLGGSPSKGYENADVVLVEFSDYRCPFCARHFRETMPRIESDYVETGKARYIFRDFPIDAIHPGAAKYHLAAHCAGEHDKYWDMHALLFARQKEVHHDTLVEYAEAKGIESKSFLDCIGSEKYADTVRRNFADGQQAMVRGTPTVFVGVALPNRDQMQALWVIRGVVPYSVVSQTIEKVLSSKKPQASMR